MSLAARDTEQLLQEHHALLREHGRVQQRCSELLDAQAREIQRLRAEAVRLRAAVVRRVTELAWARQDHERLERAIPGLPAVPPDAPDDEAEQLEATLGIADLVICQTGCLSHGDYWRVQDHCRRTGQACVLVDEAQALRIVRIHPTAEDPSAA